MINLSHNCIFLDGACPANFLNLYKGITVVVDSNHGSIDPQYCHLAIRTRKTRTCIWKTRAERMDRLVFEDAITTITCDYEQNEKHAKVPKSLTLEEDVYNELKEELPRFMKICGCYHERVETPSGLELIINHRTNNNIPMMGRLETKEIVDCICENYELRGRIISAQNVLTHLNDTCPWSDSGWLFDYAEDIRRALEQGAFEDVDESALTPLMQQFECEDIMELVDNYFCRKKKLLHIHYSEFSANAYDRTALLRMAQRNLELKDEYDKLVRSLKVLN